jgi:hypothetical protein
VACQLGPDKGGVYRRLNGRRAKPPYGLHSEGGAPGTRTDCPVFFTSYGCLTLCEAVILQWADEHHRPTGAWPQARCGAVRGKPGEKWSMIDGGVKGWVARATRRYVLGALPGPTPGRWRKARPAAQRATQRQGQAEAGYLNVHGEVTGARKDPRATDPGAHSKGVASAVAGGAAGRVSGRRREVNGKTGGAKVEPPVFRR